MDKKGDVPITLLVIGVFAICGLALLSFLNSSVQVKRSFVGFNEMEQMNLQIEKYAFENSLENLDAAKVTSDFIYIEKNGFYSVWDSLSFWTKEKILFSVKYYFPSSK